MFAKIAAFEFRYQLRQPAFWVIAIVFGLLASAQSPATMSRSDPAAMF